MNFKERKIDFHEADRRHDELVRKHGAGEINDRQFDDERKKLSVRDDEGRWWAKSAATGEWRFYDGDGWVPGIPPGYEKSSNSPPPTEKNPPASPQSERSDGRGSSVREKPMVVKRRRRYGRWAVLAVGVAAVVWGAVALFGDGFGAAYALVEHDSGNLSVEAPSDWSEHIMVDSEGEKGRASWSSWLGGGDIGPSLTAVNGLDAWQNGEEGHQGMYMVASKELADYPDEELVAVGPNDYYETCQPGDVQDFSRGGYSGKILQWSDCGGESGHVAVTLAAAPEGGECVIVMQIGGYFRSDGDEAKIEHVLDTFEADCGGI